MRIVSLLPSLTELVCDLGGRDALVGVTHECDYPIGVERLPHLTKSRIPADATSAEIDRAVASRRGSLYELDETLLARLAPDLILTQEQCDVCAVDEATVRRAAAALPGTPHVESVNPEDLMGVHAMFMTIGALIDREREAKRLVEWYRSTAAAIRRRLGATPQVPTVLLEWFDPLFSSGHWNPEIIADAGGFELLAEPGTASRRIDWEELEEADPEAILMSACGFTIEKALTEASVLAANPRWRKLTAVRAGRVAIVDGSAYFSRPGPRLATSLKIAAEFLHPGLFPEFAEGAGWRGCPVA